jgi:hypothetical protein
MTRSFLLTLFTRLPLDAPSSEEKRDHKKHEEYSEQNFCYSRRGSGNTCETEQRRDNCDYQ